MNIVLDCVGDGMTVDEIVGRYPSLTPMDVQAAAAYGVALASEGGSAPLRRWSLKIKLDVDTVLEESLGGRSDPDVSPRRQPKVDCC